MSGCAKLEPTDGPRSGLATPATDGTDRDTNPRGRRRLAHVDAAGWAAFGTFKAGITGRKGESAVARELRRLGVEALHDLVLPDGDGGLTQIDHVARGPGAVVVIETKTYAGVVEGELDGVAWTQLLTGGDGEWRYRVPNAMRQNGRHCREVAWLLGEAAGAPVRGLVVSAGTARFTGALAGAVTALTAAAPAGADVAAIPAALDAAWRVLAQAAPMSAALCEAHAEAVRARRRAAVTRRGAS